MKNGCPPTKFPKSPCYQTDSPPKANLFFTRDNSFGPFPWASPHCCVLPAFKFCFCDSGSIAADGQSVHRTGQSGERRPVCSQDSPPVSIPLCFQKHLLSALCYLTGLFIRYPRDVCASREMQLIINREG